MRFRTIAAVCPPALLGLAASLAVSVHAAAQTRDLASMSLEELSAIEVTTFRNKGQKLSSVAAPVFVITREQIERSGLGSVPELLRLAPGVHVARTNGSQWSISARGGMGVFSPRLLVLIDGRSIYTPAFSGVYWDLAMPLIEDIDRIEVIRGPGATIWGANAVLGVINIVTRNARDSQGAMVVASAGSGERASGAMRFGATAGNVAWRVTARAEDHAALSHGDGSSADDAWRTEQVSFRMDGEAWGGRWMLNGAASVEQSRLTSVTASVEAQGMAYRTADMFSSAGDITGEYRRPAGSGELRVNFYYNQVRKQHTWDRAVRARTWDGTLRYDFNAGNRHSLSVGGGVRAIQEWMPGAEGIYFDPNRLTYGNYSGFAQDEMRFLDGRVVFTAGARLERNNFTGWGVEPSASLLYQASRRHTFWTSAARSLRTPSMAERTVHTPVYVFPGSMLTAGLPIEVEVTGNPAFGNEEVTDFQAGYRADLSRQLSVSVSAYYDRYTHFRSTGLGSPSFRARPAPSLVIPASFNNFDDGAGKGVETTAAWQRYGWWKVEATHTYGMARLWQGGDLPTGLSVMDYFDAPPRNRWTLRSAWNLGRRAEADLLSLWNGRTVSNGFLGYVDCPAGARLDARLGYKLGEHWTASVVAQNLLTPRRVEGVPESHTGYSYVKRGFYVKCIWRF